MTEIAQWQKEILKEIIVESFESLEERKPTQEEFKIHMEMSIKDFMNGEIEII